MEELIKLLRYLPRYFVEFGSVFIGPKRYIGQKNLQTDKSFSDALLFLAVSLGLTIVMTAPLLPPDQKLWMFIGSQAVLILLIVTLWSIALRIAWRIVGGRATIKNFFITYSYYFGVMIIILTLFTLLSDGILKVFDPELYIKIIEATLNNSQMPEVFGSNIFVISFAVMIVGYVLLSVWGFIGWGAYRQINNLSKKRSFGALLIMGPLSWLIILVVSLVAAGMS